MKCKILQAELVRNLNKLQGLSERKPGLAHAANVLLEVTTDGLQFAATDMDITIVTRATCEVIEEGSLAIASKQLFEIVRSLPNKEVNLSTMDNYWLHIQCGRTEYKIVGLNPFDFPQLPSDHDIETNLIPAEVISRMIDRTIFCTSQDENRKHLRGVYCEWNSETNQLRMAATDGHRLTLAEEHIENMKEQPAAIVPKKAFSELKKVLAEVDPKMPIEIGFSKKRGRIQVGDTSLSIALIEGTFPNYRRVIPTNNERILHCKRGELTAALKRISILSKENENTVTLTPGEGIVSITSQNPDFGEAREDLEAVYEGPTFSACFNARYLLDVLILHNSEDIVFEMADEISPALIKSSGDDTFLAVVMPMRP